VQLLLCARNYQLANWLHHQRGD